MSTSVSVVLLAYGKCPHLAEVIAAIMAGSKKPREVIVSHSGSDDPTAELAEAFASVIVLHEEERLFAGAARNRGAAVATGDILAFCDADTRPSQDWLASVCAAFDGREDRFLVGAVGMARNGGYWGMSNWLLEFSEQAPWRPAGEQTGGASCNMATRAHDFRAAGGFNEGLLVGEDTTLFAEMRAAGLRQVFSPQAVVGHFNNAGFAAFSRHQRGLGQGFAEVRRARYMPGSFVVRRPPLAIFLSAPKAFVVLRRTLLAGLRPLALGLFLSPGVVIGATIWPASCVRRSIELARDGQG
ncbi:MAG: glycosyltransferase family 2 protein [Paracoccaceae bacterium]|nr:glycosyltransferase family 2 protein [Paracoccaceae bacterium]